MSCGRSAPAVNLAHFPSVCFASRLVSFVARQFRTKIKFVLIFLLHISRWLFGKEFNDDSACAVFLSLFYQSNERETFKSLRHFRRFSSLFLVAEEFLSSSHGRNRINSLLMAPSVFGWCVS